MIGGRNLLDLAIKGCKYYKKAMAYNTHLWDTTRMEPKNSGHTIQDCINHVRRKMYLDTLKGNNNNDEECEVDSESEDVADKDLVDDTGRNEAIETNHIATIVTSDSNIIRDTNEAAASTTAAAPTYDDSDASVSSTPSEDSISVPDDYLFPSYFVFILWGPYVHPDQRVNCMLIDDKDKKNVLDLVKIYVIKNQTKNVIMLTLILRMNAGFPQIRELKLKI